MATLKEHQAAMVDLLANGSAIPASASRLAHAMHDVLEIVANSDLMQFVQKEQLRVRELNDATTTGLNDKALSEPQKPLKTDSPAKRPKAERFNVNIKLSDMGEVKTTLHNMQSHMDGARDSQRAAENRVKELENTIRQLKGNLAKVRTENDVLHRENARLENALVWHENRQLPEQAGVRKEDTQVCEHDSWEDVAHGDKRCCDCGETFR